MRGKMEKKNIARKRQFMQLPNGNKNVFSFCLKLSNDF